MADLEDALLIATRRASTARTATAKLQERITQTNQARGNAASEVHRRRFGELRRERGRIDEKIEEAMSTLLEGLSELEDIHNKQVGVAQEVSPEFGQGVAQQPVQRVIESYLSARLWLFGFETNAATPLYQANRMAEADPLAAASEATPDADA